jgi:hypothetical protein
MRENTRKTDDLFLGKPLLHVQYLSAFKALWGALRVVVVTPLFDHELLVQREKLIGIATRRVAPVTLVC